MANVDRPRGFTPIRYKNGAPWCGKGTRYHVPSSHAAAIFKGSAVKKGASSDADGVPDVAVAGTGEALLGFVTAIQYDKTNLNTRHLAASTEGYVFVCDDPMVIFEAQEDSDGGAGAAADANLNCELTAEVGNTSTGRSTMEIDISTKDTTATLPLKLLGLHRNGKNAFGNYAAWEVMINNHQLKGHTGTAGA